MPVSVQVQIVQNVEFRVASEPIHCFLPYFFVFFCLSFIISIFILSFVSFYMSFFIHLCVDKQWKGYTAPCSFSTSCACSVPVAVISVGSCDQTGVVSRCLECCAVSTGTKTDHCRNKPCLLHGECISLPDRYECKCAAGYSGNNCEINNGETESFNSFICLDYEWMTFET